MRGKMEGEAERAGGLEKKCLWFPREGGGRFDES